MQLVVEQGQIYGLALCFGEEAVYGIAAEGFLTGQYLADTMSRLVKKAEAAWVLDLKKTASLSGGGGRQQCP